MIEMGEAYRTRDGREVRIYATDGLEKMERGPIHGAYWSEVDRGWIVTNWFSDGRWSSLSENNYLDLIPADPHGILPRHRELLAGIYQELNYREVTAVLRSDKPALALPYDVQAALIALARLDREKGE